MKKLLVLSSGGEVHAEAVAGKVLNLGGEAYCFRVDKFPFEYFITRDECGTYTIGQHGVNEIELDESWSIWNKRRVSPTFPADMSLDLKLHIEQEATKTIDGLLLEHSGRVIDRPNNIFLGRNKPYQLMLAKSLGLDTPKTLISNNSYGVKEFHKNQEKMIMKQHTVPVIGDNFMLTTALNIEDNIDYNRIRNCPAIFQEKLLPKNDIRVTVIGDELIPISITPREEYDFSDIRAVDYLKCDYEKVEIPDEVELSIRKMMEHYGLSYGSFDFIHTKDDRYVFLELNPRGQYLWLEHLSGFDITSSLVDLLVKD